MVTGNSLEGNTANSGESASKGSPGALACMEVIRSMVRFSSPFCSSWELGIMRYRPGPNVRTHASMPALPVSHATCLTRSCPRLMRRSSPSSDHVNAPLTTVFYHSTKNWGIIDNYMNKLRLYQFC